MEFERKILAVKLANGILSPCALALIHARENAKDTLLEFGLVNSEQEANAVVEAVLDGTADIVQLLERERKGE